MWSRGGGSAPHRRPPRGPAHRCTPGDGHDTRDGVQLHKAMMVERDNMPKCHTESSLTMKCRQLDSGHPPFSSFTPSSSSLFLTFSPLIHHLFFIHLPLIPHSSTSSIPPHPFPCAYPPLCECPEAGCCGGLSEGDGELREGQEGTAEEGVRRHPACGHAVMSV